MQMLDIRTIAITFFINSIVATLFMAALWRQSRKQVPGISLWLISFALLTAAFVLVSLRNIIPDAASIFVANTFVAAAAFIIYLGLERFVDCPSSQRHNYIILTVFVVLFTYFTFFQPDVAIRIVLLNITLNLMFLQASWLMLHRVGSQLKPLSRATGIVCLMYALAGCYRLILVIFMPAPGDYLNVNLWDAIGLLINQILTIGLVLVLILMVNRRMLLNNLNQEEILVRSKVELEISNRDLTEHKRIESALKESEEKYRLLADNTVDGVWLLDMNLKLIYCSPASEKQSGFTLQEIMEMSLEQYFTPESLKVVAEAFLEELPKAEADPDYNPIITLDLEFYKKDGSAFWAESKFSVIRDNCGKPVSILAHARDISEHRRIESALKESEEKYRLLVENAMEAIVIEVDGTVKFANRRTSQLTGYSQEELTSRPFSEFIHPDDRQMVAERYIQWLKGENVPTTDTLRFIFRQGDIRWGELSVVLITWEGRPATLGFLTDVTDRKRLEEEEQRVARLESVGLLAGGIAHDFNNILTAILGNISLAKMETQPGSELHDRLELAEKASLRARELTKQLLTFSKGGAPVKKLASLRELLRDTAGFALRGSNVRCSFSIPDDLWHAEIDAGQVSQVVHNLVINAVQAMPAGGTIELTAENMALSETQSLGMSLPLKEGNYIRISVTDHGSGIAEEHLDKVFDPFFSTKKSSGLGLATSFSITRYHGGHLSVESEPGSGSTFYLYLPASTETFAGGQDKKEEMAPAGEARILVMDDEKGVREVAGRMLRHIGYADVDFAADGAAAVKLYEAAMESGNPFSLVILDLTIPGGMGGSETIKQLLKIDPGVKAIVSSGYADESVMAEYKDYGFCGMVAKPYSIGELGKAVRDLTH
jgi:two-component system cell cycle sensor histidine kinase/response regulator CckA